AHNRVSAAMAVTAAVMIQPTRGDGSRQPTNCSGTGGRPATASADLAESSATRSAGLTLASAVAVTTPIVGSTPVRPRCRGPQRARIQAAESVRATGEPGASGRDIYGGRR